MLIQNAPTVARQAPIKSSPPVAATPKEETRSRFEEFSDCLVASNQEVLPSLAAFGLGYAWANLGIELGSQFGLGAAVVGGLGLGLGGSLLGYEVGAIVEKNSDATIDVLFNSPSSATKAIAKTAFGVAASGLFGGPTGAAIYGISALGGATLGMGKSHH